MKTRPRRQMIAAFSLCLVVAACHRGGPAPATAGAPGTDGAVTIRPDQRSRLQTEPVELRRYNPVVTTTGTVTFNGDHSTQVIAPISGPVIRLLVGPGDTVRAGQALALVASPDFASDVSTMRKTDAVWKNAQRIASLDEKLFANDALARADLDQARSDLSSAIADRDAAIQQLYALGIDSASVEALRQGRAVPGAQAAIRAPIAGTVVERLISPGQLLQAGTTPAFTIADLTKMWVMANVFESDVGAVARGERALIFTGASADSIAGTVDYVSAEVDPSSKATGVRIVVPNRGGTLRENMLVTVRISSAREQSGMLVPVSAVLRDDENLPYVYVVSPGDSTRFLRRRLALGGRVGEAYPVTSGLSPGDVVVTQGALYLEEDGSQ